MDTYTVLNSILKTRNMKENLPVITVVITHQEGKCADCNNSAHFLVLEKPTENGEWQIAWYYCGECEVGG